MMSTESAENVSQFFVTAADLAKQCCGLDLHKQVWQLHKDYAKAWKQPGKPISQQQDHAMTMRTRGGLPTSSWRNYSAPSCLRPRLYMLQRERMITIGGFSRKRRPSSGAHLVECVAQECYLTYAWCTRVLLDIFDRLVKCRPKARARQREGAV